MGSAHQQDGVWRAYWRDAAGRQRTKGGFSNYNAAKQHADVQEHRAKRSQDKGTLAWGDYFDEVWLPTRHVAPLTQTMYETHARLRIKPEFGHVPIEDIEQHAIATWVRKMVSSRVGPVTVKETVAVLSSSLRYAARSQWINGNPAEGVVLPRRRVRVGTAITPGQAEALLANIPRDSDRLAVELMLNLGLRWGEVAGLHWNRIDLERAILVVQETYDDHAGDIKPNPKSGRPRAVGIPPHIMNLLPEPARGTCGITHRDGARCESPLVLTALRGGALQRHTWRSRVWDPARKAADLPNLRIHDLRHTHASWLADQGTDLNAIAQQLGHSMTWVTERYAHLNPDGRIVKTRLAITEAHRRRHAVTRGRA